MFDWRARDEWRRLWRYYQAGVVNLLFGFGMYALFVRVGMNIFVAQICAHISGVIFNYFTYSRYVFSGDASSKTRFALSYAFNYFLSVIILYAVVIFIPSPYLSGLIVAVIVSIVNFFILKRIVFRRQVLS